MSILINTPIQMLKQLLRKMLQNELQLSAKLDESKLYNITYLFKLYVYI